MLYIYNPSHYLTATYSFLTLVLNSLFSREILNTISLYTLQHDQNLRKW